ncbi:MAG TPA: glucose 1-dehydrogenase [Gaiellaceae bacterium]|jgi:3alpha(or 20beta)-hydroxysteroid dehydrogenase
MARLDGKVALITGAARGMGRTTAELFAQEGAQVIAGDVREPDPPFDSDAIQAIHLDVSSEDAWKQAVGDAVERYGRIDILVNNAGVIQYEGLEEMTLEIWHRTIAVDQTGVFLGMREVVPVMKRNGGGSIVNISSIWGSAAVSGAHAYHAAKSAVRNMTKNVAMEYATDGIRANSVHPGYIVTPLTEVQAPEVNQLMIDTTPMHRPGQPIEVAYGTLYLASDEASYVTGIELVIDGGYLAQ